MRAFVEYHSSGQLLSIDEAAGACCATWRARTLATTRWAMHATDNGQLPAAHRSPVIQNSSHEQSCAFSNAACRCTGQRRCHVVLSRPSFHCVVALDQRKADAWVLQQLATTTAAPVLVQMPTQADLSRSGKDCRQDQARSLHVYETLRKHAQTTQAGLTGLARSARRASTSRSG